jgi:hypothetical protein
MRSIFQRRRTWHRKQRQSAVLTPRNQVRQLRKENGYCILGRSGDAKTGSHHSAIGIKTQSICFGTSQSLCVARPPLTATDTARVYEYGRGYFVTIHDHDFAANTHILAHAGRILATVEGGALPYEISDELNTVGPYDFTGALPASFAAHTKTDQQKGEVHAIAYSYRQDHVQHIVIDKTGKVSRITEIAVRDKPIMHDFALTEKYVVLYDLPVTFSLLVPRHCLRSGTLICSIALAIMGDVMSKTPDVAATGALSQVQELSTHHNVKQFHSGKHPT